MGFRGANNLKLDGKGRVMIPARLRDELIKACDGNVVITAHPHGCLAMFPEPVYEPLFQKLAKTDGLDPAVAHVRRMLLGTARNESVDGTGRVMIAPELRAYAGLGKDVFLSGVGEYLEIWSAEKWQQQMDAAQNVDWVAASARIGGADLLKSPENYNHITVLKNEAVAALLDDRFNVSGFFVDATFGRGGHSRLLLERLADDARLLAFDKDPQAIHAAGQITDKRFAIVHASFADIREQLEQRGVAAVDGVLLDLGISSPQIDQAERGMSFRFDAPLDMRMNNSCGATAAEWLATASINTITEVIKKYGEERFAYAIAKAVIAVRSEHPIETTGQLAALVEKVVRTREPGQHPATRTFQAIRIFINQELEDLSLVLDELLRFLKPGGRLVVISFHSLEDRIVKRFMRDNSQPEKVPKCVPLRSDQLRPAKLRLIGRATRPSVEEVKCNPRARSAVMRVAQRLAQ